jgi:hypothetical protein
MKRRVIFPDPGFWTNRRRTTVATDDNRAPINRPLTDDERALLTTLATRVIADQSGIPHTEGVCRACSVAATVLDGFVDEGDVHVYGDAYDCYLAVGPNRELVHTARDWLAFHAEHPEAIDYDKHCHPINKEADE